jgi:murein DD-endopeptidase MepM/ murein hydrolase activator NlpD
MNKLVKEILFWGGALAIIFIFCKHKPFWISIIWILVWGAFVELVNRLVRSWNKGRKNSEKSTDPRFNTPQKALRVALNYQISNFLFAFNPFLLVQIILQITGKFWERNFGRPVLQAEQYNQKADYILPITGEWFVFNGGVTRETSHSWGIPTQRFAYDLVKFGKNDRTFESGGRKLKDYFCYDAPVLAPADGVVVKARDGIHDAPFVGTFWMDCFTRNIAGNSVLIKHADSEYCLLAHLKHGSVKVKVGETVKQGQEIGRCGHSGNSTEPHLHFQFQNGKSFYFSSGLPVKFSNFWRRESEQKNCIKQDYISKKTFVSAGE